ncbi:MAG: nucleotidyltransferase [Candidatus Binatia bacterium]
MSRLKRFRTRSRTARDFYRRVVRTLGKERIPFLLGGGFALEFYIGRGRRIKDMDIFVYRKDVSRIFEVLGKAGFWTEMAFTHWLAKVFDGDLYLDVIFSSGNGLCEVDDLWFEHSAEGKVFGLSVRFCPPEEMLWSKAFIMERERYDGNDVAHLLLACGQRLDWDRLVFRFGAHWRVLLSHLILFGYIYPSERDRLPQAVIRELLGRLERELRMPTGSDQPCQGPLLSRIQYRVDVEEMGYRDARLPPEGKMTHRETADWTAAGDPAEAK